MLEIGQVGKFIVKRETDISYTLAPIDENLTTYIFLHFNQATRKLEMGEIIEAFLYYDGKRRLCATMEKPYITTTHYDFVEVVNSSDIGVFVNIGIAKDILLSTDFLPKNKEAWPRIGEKIPCLLKVKKDQLIARIVNKEDFRNSAKKPLEKNTTVLATVSRLTSEGLGLYTDNFEYIFVHKSMTRKKYHLGEKVEVNIININQYNEANGSFIKQKELSRLDDSQIILNYLNTFGGMLPLGNASTPDDIKRYFTMSKSAFKRAVGALYKQRLIEISDNKITLLSEKMG